MLGFLGLTSLRWYHSTKGGAEPRIPVRRPFRQGEEPVNQEQVDPFKRLDKPASPGEQQILLEW